MRVDRHPGYLQSGTLQTNLDIVQLTYAKGYSVVLYSGLGFTGVIPLVLGASYVTSTIIANWISALLIDRVGRVNLMVAGLIGCALALCFEAAITASFQGTSNTAGLKAGVFFFFLYVFMFVFPYAQFIILSLIIS